MMHIFGACHVYYQGSYRALILQACISSRAVCIVLYNCSIVSFYTGSRRCTPFVHRVALDGEKKSPAFRPQYRTNLPSPHHHAAALSILKSYTCSVLVQSEKRVPASRYAKPLNPSCTYPNPSSSSRKRNALCFFSFTCRQHPSAHASSTAC